MQESKYKTSPHERPTIIVRCNIYPQTAGKSLSLFFVDLAFKYCVST